MRDEKHSAAVVCEELLHPGAGLYVEVVGGLVQEQDVGSFQDGARQGDPHLPARGERGTGGIEVLRREPQPPQHPVDRLRARVVAAGLQPLLQLVMLPQQRIPLGRLGGERPQALLQRGDLLQEHFPAGEGLLRLLAERTVRVHHSGLGHVGYPRILLRHHGAHVRDRETGHDAHERRLAAAVGAHEGRA